MDVVIPLFEIRFRGNNFCVYPNGTFPSGPTFVSPPSYTLTPGDASIVSNIVGGTGSIFVCRFPSEVQNNLLLTIRHGLIIRRGSKSDRD